MKYLLPLLLVFVLTIGFHGTRRALGEAPVGEAHPPEHQSLHDKFYATWMIPSPGAADHRKHSCCNKKDCYPTQTKFENGQWFFLHRETNNWIAIPTNKLEHLQNDPRESPDGRSHVCADETGLRVFCATLGGAI